MKRNDRKWQLQFDQRFSWYRWKRHQLFIFLALATLTVCLISTPLLATLAPVTTTTNLDKSSSVLPCDASPAQLTNTQPVVLFEQGRQCYETGAFEGAEAMWSSAATAYAQTGDRIGEIRSRINQAQALKALGNYSLALKVLKNLNETVVQTERPFLELKAKILRSLGDVQQLVGDADNVPPITNADLARNTLKQSLQIAQDLNSADAMSAACFSLGLVERAEINRIQFQERTLDSVFTLQTQVGLALQAFQVAAQTAPTAVNTLQAELNRLSLLANTLPQFNAFWETLPKLKDDELRLLLTHSPDEVQAALALSQPGASSSCMTIATQQSNVSVPDQPASQKLLIVRNQTVQWTDALFNVLSQVQAQLLSLPPSRMAVDARINFAQSLTQLRMVANSAAKADRHLQILLKEQQRTQSPAFQQPIASAPKSLHATPLTTLAANPKLDHPIFLSVQVQARLQSLAAASFKDAADILEQAIAEAHALPNKRSEALARVMLAELYATDATAKEAETSQTSAKLPNLEVWTKVETLSQEALTLATESNATTIVFQAQRQLAQAYQKQNKIPESRASCQVGADTLKALRGDLVAIDQNVQFNFRDKVAPFYRECAATLLPSEHEDQSSDLVQQNLEAARNMIESLQLAEIDDFLREACIQGQKVPIDKLVEQNPKTAFIYAIVLSDRKLGVIAKISDLSQASKEKAATNTNQPKPPKLIYHSVELAEKETISAISTALAAQLSSISPNTSNLQAVSNKVYQWLIAPFEIQMELQLLNSAENKKTDTIVFVLDKALRGIPMAALYDGRHYLVQKSAIAVSPGLQLLNSTPITQEKLNVFAAGLSKTIPPGFERFGRLDGVEAEFELMERAKVITAPLLDAHFTRKAFADALNQAPYNVVHLATHGEFNFPREKTFILTADGSLAFDQLSAILRSRSRQRPEPIDLLVLSACDTAKSSDDRATLGLAGLALQSGVHSTLASLWSVKDTSTARLMETFYKALSSRSQPKDAKITKAIALQLAQNELLSAKAKPFQWAPYVLVGNWL